MVNNVNSIYKFIDEENNIKISLIDKDSKLITIRENLNNNTIVHSEGFDDDFYNIDYDMLTMFECCKPIYISKDAHILLWTLIGDLFPNGELDDYEEEIKKYIQFCKNNEIEYHQLIENEITNINNIYLLEFNITVET